MSETIERICHVQVWVDSISVGVIIVIIMIDDLVSGANSISCRYGLSKFEAVDKVRVYSSYRCTFIIAQCDLHYLSPMVRALPLSLPRTASQSVRFNRSTGATNNKAPAAGAAAAAVAAVL